MGVTKKDAGEARQPPRTVAASRQAALGAPTGAAPTGRPAGIAPVPTAGRAPALADDAHKGMISNPWVKHWAGAGPAPTTTRPAGRQPRPATHTKAADESKAAAKSKAAPRAGRQRARRSSG
jgi:hypothetical protein